ncbi:TM0106 family RecB-like putative nuclease [Chryseolinea sp. T2]|uniref:TM0106 family RecB-like putative nuclease n=1 Tax=Chryseolinea sp. T2 TaxID=3129255 RepID=UPI003078A259
MILFLYEGESEKMNFQNDQLRFSATDLSDYLGCEHLTSLSKRVALGELKRPYRKDPAIEALIQRGAMHEAAYVENLRSRGLTIVDLRGKDSQATSQALQNGADVLIQATLTEGAWGGIADIIIKVDGNSSFGPWTYEVQDTKLARQTKSGAILQLCLYTDLLAKMLGTTPGYMHIIRPDVDFKPESYRFDDFRAYYQMMKDRLESFVKDNSVKTYPVPVEHCGVCRWWKRCDTQWRDDDHLSLVAGMRNAQVEELSRQNIRTLEQFALTTQVQAPLQGNLEALLRRKTQAELQYKARIAKELLEKDLPIESGRGLFRLPLPNEGDVYFDIEGDPFFDAGGLEYLLGYVVRDANDLKYSGRWSRTRMEERDAFGAFMHFLMGRWKRYPGFHIYHFAPYEPSAIKRLARVHAIYEKEVDQLLRAERFIDLHAVVKESLMASVERYSLKEIEKFTTYTRQIDLTDAGPARKVLEVALELHQFNDLPADVSETVERYNDDDCRATAALHDWLEKIRTRREAAGEKFERPLLKTGEAGEEIELLETRSTQIFHSIVSALPEDRNNWSNENRAMWLLAHMIDYFRREAKSAYWEYYRLHELDDEDVISERKAIGGMTFVGVQPKRGKERNTTHRYSFHPQETSLNEGDEVVAVKGEKLGTVREISLKELFVDIKKRDQSLNMHAESVHLAETPPLEPLPTALMDLAVQLEEDGLGHSWPYAASKDLLMKRAPVTTGGYSPLVHADVLDEAVHWALHLDKSILPIQGPPGSGKTHTGAAMILALIKAGKKIGVTATSHKVIRNLLNKVKELSGDTDVRLAHKVSDKDDVQSLHVQEILDNKAARSLLDQGFALGGTAWLWADKNFDKSLDYLFVDEAGQMSLSYVLAASRCSRNIILLGDPQQLEQPQRGAHPEGSDVSALNYLLDGHATIQTGRGLFLSTTRRLCPALCAFTSELFYEGRLRSLPELTSQRVGGDTKFDGAGLFYVPVHHVTNQDRSYEEVSVIEKIVHQLLAMGTWTDAENRTRKLTIKDILVVAPYNSQVSALLGQLPELHIGTVDKFQGQEAPVVIYSMTSSSVSDAPRGMSFLFNPHRLNVATSRARGICILVASPRLFEAECHTIEQMRWANSLCRYHEMATTVKME